MVCRWASGSSTSVGGTRHSSAMRTILKLNEGVTVGAIALEWLSLHSPPLLGTELRYGQLVRLGTGSDEPRRGSRYTSIQLLQVLCWQRSARRQASSISPTQPACHHRSGVPGAWVGSSIHISSSHVQRRLTALSPSGLQFEAL
jgi:hypothetical protein